MRAPLLATVLFAVLATACSAGGEVLRKDEAFDSGMAVPNRTQELVLVANAHRDCDQEQLECFAECWKSPPPWPYKRGDKSYGTYCANLCLKKYMRCIEELKSRPVAFPTMHAALQWIHEHETELLVGTIVVVAGAAFVVGTGGSGALILVPIAAAL